MSAPSSHRIAPAGLGIIMAPPSKIAKDHAKQRLEYQMRVLAFLCLLRARGDIHDSAQAEEAKTQYQHGSGDVGEQAAHKIIVSLAIGGKPLIDLCRADSALYMAMIFLHSDTSALPRCWNMADDELEKGGVRTKVVTLANAIISKIQAGSSYAEYTTCMKEVWGQLRTSYFTHCVNYRRYMVEAFEGACKQAAKVEDVIKSASTPNQHLQEELAKARRLQKDALEKVIVFDVYVEVVDQIGFPLTDGELDNMWELVFGRAPVKAGSEVV